ncbi:MAG TPA: 4-alpha-glucanotransferase [Egibacteraceae bacterium]|nr:4-alpha-glucanotransferase [Egibacteraceae bacterium]
MAAAPVRLALQAMGVPAGNPDEVAASLAQVRHARAARTLPPTLVVRPGKSPDLPDSPLLLTTEDGAEQTVRGHLPQQLPYGYHRLASAAGESTHLIVTPGRCPLPLTAPGFGWMVQLYAARSEASWGMGDYRDLATVAGWGGDVGAAMILVNPLHATAPVLPQEASPYSPTSRRYRNPLYLRIEDLPELELLTSADRQEVTRLAETARRAGGADRIERDDVFTAKMAALALLHAVAPRAEQRDATYRRWRDAEGTALRDFATFCALAERHGAPWQDWPAALQHPRNDAVAAEGAELADRVELHCWLQWLCDTQLEAAQAVAVDNGMAVGIVHDLAVGVDPGGADAWALQDDLATGVTVGAPPDGFNQKGQDWALPPLLPARLPQTGYAPFRDMLRSVLRHAGGIRIDHIMGLWRLWWVPADRSAAEGTYVRYPAEDLLGVLALEAHRAGAMVVGEDLGTVEEGVRDTMAGHQILSSRVTYFERIDDDPEQPMLPSDQYPELALTSITTHDLPTPAGWWADEDVRVQTELDLFGSDTTPEQQAERKAGERRDMLDLLRSEGLVGQDPTDDELLFAMHAFLARTPSRLVATGLGDALGDRRQPNMPGTTTAYPNWRLPLARWTGQASQPVSLEAALVDPGVQRIAEILRARPRD